MKRIIVLILTLIIVLSLKADPIIFVQGKPPFDNNYAAILTPSQTTNFWGCILYDPDFVLPSCAATNHIQGATIILMADGSTKVNLIWMADPSTNVNMMAKMKANSPIKGLIKK